MDEQQFKKRADDALESLYRKLAIASDCYDFEPDFNNGALSIEFEEPKAKFVVSPNSPVKQIWVSAHSRSFKLDWDDARQLFVFPENGNSLEELMRTAIGTQLDEEITL